jgi:hypothetical protein
MAQQSVENSSADGQQAEQEPVPQDDRFWKRYSPHHEFPLSSAASVALHVMAIAVLILGGILAARWGFGDSGNSIPLSILDDPGGGGQPDGSSSSAGGEGVVQPKESASDASKSNTVAQAPTTPSLVDPKAQPLTLPQIQDSQGRFVDESNQVMKELNQLDKEVRDKLFNSLAGASNGKGGTGSGGGKGGGTGPGTGSGKGEGNLSVRQKRVLRWEVNFRVNSPEDHIRQFAALGAILAIPDPQGRYHVFRDLNHRVGRVEDLSNINRIWFIDRNPETVAGISSLLRMPPPPVLIAFFPQELEERMAEMEKQYRGQREDDLHDKFKFQVVPRGGTYQVVVGE